MNETLSNQLNRYSKYISGCFDVSCGILNLAEKSCVIPTGLVSVNTVVPVITAIRTYMAAMRQNDGTISIFITVLWA